MIPGLKLFFGKNIMSTPILVIDLSVLDLLEDDEIIKLWISGYILSISHTKFSVN